MLQEVWEYIRDKEKRPSLSNIIYLLCSFIEMLCAFSLISPFHFSVLLLDEVSWTGNLSNRDVVVQIGIGTVILSFLVYVVKEIGIRIFQERNDNQLCSIYATIYTIHDIVDLISSIILLFFIIAVFIQVYKTRVMYVSRWAYCIYTVIGFRGLKFLWYHFRTHNINIINRVLKNK